MLLLPALLGLLLFASAHAVKPYVDVPYEEIVSQRFTLSTATPVYNWGQLPFDSVTQVLLGNITSDVGGAFVLSTSALIFIQTNADFTEYDVVLQGINLVQGSQIAVDGVSGQLTAVATPTNVYEVQCTLTSNILNCNVLNSAPASFGTVNNVIAVSDDDVLTIYVASNGGGFVYVAGKSLTLLQAEPPTAVAYFAPKNLLAFGGNESLTTYINNAPIRRDWATDIASGSGGVYDGPITSLAFDKYGWLFVGTTACVNILFPNSTVNHLSRFQGLPFNVTTSLSIEYNTRL